jgi:RNA polymerase sigma-70 factor (ECF subfamily)
LAVRAALGDADSRRCFGELVVRFEARLFNFLLRRVKSKQDAEDLTQEAFVRAWQRIGSYDPAWRFSTWLFTIATRLAITTHRRSKLLPVTAYVENAGERTTVAAPDLERGGKLWHLASRHLTQDQHTALWLRYVEDMAIDEIAVVMHKSDVGVRVCLFRARQALASLVGAPTTGEVVVPAKGVAPAAGFAGGVP